jgi:hypothetical protein
LTALADDGGERYLGELGSGETVGETDLVDAQPRMSNVRAIRDAQLVRISPRGFDRLVRENAGALKKIATVLAGRMRAMVSHKQPVPVLRTIVILGARSAPFSEFTWLGARLAFGPPCTSTNSGSTNVRQTFDADSEIVPWLSELERLPVRGVSGAALVRQPTRCPPWAGRGPARLNATEVVARERRVSAHPQLVPIHERFRHSFPGTATWLAPDPSSGIISSSGVREDPGDLARDPRGMRDGCDAVGAAHRRTSVGFARPRGAIPIDMICGVSGRVIAGLYAMGWDWPTMIASTSVWLADRRLNMDLALPRFR